MKNEYKVEFFRLSNKEQKNTFQQLCQQKSPVIFDEIEAQLRELIKSLHPAIKIKQEEYPSLIAKHLKGCPINEYGVWVYYTWANRMVHLLDEGEFVEVRTNRNRYKITREEQNILATKKIGIVGLSVGQSIALTLAMERIGGELRLADFDTAELSNLNRIRTGVHNLGLKKTIVAAREILEIDPYLKVKTFDDGVTKDNIDDFFTKDGMLDMLVEVCDGLDIKIVSRYKARELKIPVLMDTNDRGMLDVERFDLEPGRPVLHGLAGDLDPNKIKGLSNEDKVPYILKMIGAETISTRLKASMMEVEQSINTWPQLASSVTLGGALVADTARRVLLGQFHESGRYYVDFEEIIKDAKTAAETITDYEGPKELTKTDLYNIAAAYNKGVKGLPITSELLNTIVEAASMAPSGGNSQPWKFLYRDNKLFVFHDIHFSYSLLDVNNTGSYIAFGAVLENIEIKSAELGLLAEADVFPLADKRLIAVVSFENKAITPFRRFSSVIPIRHTNRNITIRQPLKTEHKKLLLEVAQTIPNAKLDLFEQEAQLQEFAEILTNAERVRFLHERGHYDTFVKELRFTEEEVAGTKDGLDIETLNMTNSEKAALQIAKDSSAISFLNRLGQGGGFKDISRKNIMTASAMGVLTMNGHDSMHFLQAGKALQRIWLEATNHNIAVQPITQVIFMIERFIANGGVEFNDFEKEELERIRHDFYKLIKIENGRYPVFVFRLFYGAPPSNKALRKPVDNILFIN